MHHLPLDLDLDSLPGPKRGVPPAIYVRDEMVTSPSLNRFALAYTIAEASMGNEIGCLLWGELAGAAKARVLGNPAGVHVTCWYSPWAVWLNDETFIFKAQHHDGRRLHLPLVAVHVKDGFAILPSTNNGHSRPSDVKHPPAAFSPASARSLLRAIASDA